MQNVKLKSSDGVEFILTTEVAYRSEKLKEIFRHQGLNETVTLSEVNEYMLEKVVTWMDKYKDGSPFDINDDKDLSSEYNEWDLEYLKMERETLFALTRAEDNMKVRGLVNYCAEAIANLIRGKTSAQIRGVVGLPRLNPMAQRRHPNL